MTSERYGRLCDLLTSGAAHLSLEGDKTASEDCTAILADLLDTLSPEEGDKMVHGMVDTSGVIDFCPIRGASMPPAIQPQIIQFGGR